MHKYGDKTKVEVLTDKESSAILSHKQRLGKSVEDFTDEEREDLREELEKIQNEK
jgi:hypothetical protein